MSQLTLELVAARAEKLQDLGIRRRVSRSVQRETKPTIAERFKRFHRENPEIYDLLVRLAREAKRDGFEKYSMKTLYEVARWRCRKRSTGESGFVMNNDFTSHYARLIEEQEPDLKEFFEKRQLRSE